MQEELRSADSDLRRNIVFAVIALVWYAILVTNENGSTADQSVDQARIITPGSQSLDGPASTIELPFIGGVPFEYAAALIALAALYFLGQIVFGIAHRRNLMAIQLEGWKHALPYLANSDLHQGLVPPSFTSTLTLLKDTREGRWRAMFEFFLGFYESIGSAISFVVAAVLFYSVWIRESLPGEYVALYGLLFFLHLVPAYITLLVVWRDAVRDNERNSVHPNRASRS
jgi:hypothetical protein